MATDPTILPLRVAERAGRLLFWALQLDLSRRERELACWFIVNADSVHLDTLKSFETIAAGLGVSARTVQDAARDLEGRGLLSREARTNPDGSRTANRMRLTPPLDLVRLRSSEAERADLGHEDELDPADYAIDGTSHSHAPGNNCRPGTAEIAEPVGMRSANTSEPIDKPSGRTAEIADRIGMRSEVFAEELSSIEEERESLEIQEGSSAISAGRSADVAERGPEPPPFAAPRRRLPRTAADVFTTAVRPAS